MTLPDPTPDNPWQMPRRDPTDRPGDVTVIAPPREAAVMAGAGTQLEQLCAMYDQLKVRAEDAAAAFEALKTAIKVELQNQAPDSAKVTVSSSHLARPLVMAARCTRTIDSKALRAKEPALAEQFTKEVWSWRLEAQR